MALLTENDIIDIVYALKEGDDDGWDTESDEYLAGRRYCNAAIRRWEAYENTRWKELFVKLSDAATGDKTVTASTWDYDCPDDFRFPTSWVRTINVNSTYWQVVPVTRVGELANSNSNYCYFTGSRKAGFTLHFNPNLTLNTGDTIEYEYYKEATQFTATTSTTEMDNPEFIIQSVLAQFIKNDGEDNLQELQTAEEALEQMRVNNEEALFGVPYPIEESIATRDGFGI